MRLSFTILVLFSLSLLFGQTNDSWQTKINPQILTQLKAGHEQKVIIAFSEQANLSGAYAIRGKTAKATYVYEQVQIVAERSQGVTKSILRRAQRPFRAFGIVNAIYTTVDLATAQQIATLANVANIQGNPWTGYDRPVQDLSLNAGRETGWGTDHVRAPEVWAMGIRGAGVTVAGQDTGYDWEHPTIKAQYRGWNGSTADHNYHWHDAIREINLLNQDSTISPTNNPCGLDVDTPCDDNNHGTHTMGTMVGDDGGENQIGVAPEATWIGCRNMERGWGSPASYIECFDWFLAPTDLDGNFPDPAKAPHVINNSWRCPTVEGCDEANVQLMEVAVNALHAAGVVVVASAGNDGPTCETIDAPPAIFAKVLTVGAISPADTVARFSSRGSVAVDGSYRLKPDVIAPGVGIRSAVRDSSYRTWGGTSMAGPHVAGTIALMIAANPDLAGEVDTIMNILRVTSIERLHQQVCAPFDGGISPNPITGYGTIDALAAVQAALQLVGAEAPTLLQTFRIFPNPSNGKVTVDYSANWTDKTVTLYNPFGQRLWQKPLLGTQQTFNLSALPTGWYVFQIGDTDSTTQQRVYLQR